MTIPRSIFKLFIYIIIGFITLIIPLTLPPVQNFIAGKLLKSLFLSNYSKINNLKVEFGVKQIYLNDVSVDILGEKFFIPKIKFQYTLKDLLFSPMSRFKATSDKIIVGNEKVIFSLKVDGQYDSVKGATTSHINLETSEISEYNSFVSNIKINSTLESLRNEINFNNTKLTINEGTSTFDLSLKFLDGFLYEITSKGKLKNIPFNLYKLALTEDSNIRKFLEQNISADRLKEGNFDINIPHDFIVKFMGDNSKKSLAEKNLNKYIDIKKGAKKAEADNSDFKNQLKKAVIEEHIKGKFVFENVAYKYFEAFPEATINELPIKLKGNKLSIDLTGAQTALSTATEGTLEFDIASNEPNIIISAKAEGDTAGLVKFIDPKIIAKLEHSNIPLSKMSGTINTDVEIKIPLEDKPNKYDINSKIQNFTLNILGSKINFSDYNIKGHFDGKKISIYGDGLINDFASKTDFMLYLDDGPFLNKINSTIFLAKSDYDKKNKEFFGVEVLDGGTSVECELITNNASETKLDIHSNLRNVHFLIPAISFEKPKGEMSNLQIKGNLSEGKNQNLKINLEGKDNVIINGNLISDKNKTILNFTEINHDTANLEAKIIINDNRQECYLKGKLLDLSKTNFSTFLNQNSSEVNNLNKEISHDKINHKRSMLFKVDIDKVILKNKNELTDAKLYLDCSNNNCEVARFRSNINGSDFIIAGLKDTDSQNPKWYLETNQAGKFFSALDISKKIINGNLSAEITYPIINKNQSYTAEGNIYITKFKVRENKLLSRIVSFISIPGLLNALRDNLIPFDGSKIVFNYKDNLFVISNMEAIGPYFSLFTKGSIDTSQRRIYMRGQVIPSLYGINNLVGSIPIIKMFFGRSGAVIFTPFYLDDKF